MFVQRKFIVLKHSDETVLRISPGPNNDQETDRDDIVEEQTESVADLMFPVNQQL
jgi:hypothetical protein